jgi:hypothetical protein
MDRGAELSKLDADVLAELPAVLARARLIAFLGGMHARCGARSSQQPVSTRTHFDRQVLRVATGLAGEAKAAPRFPRALARRIAATPLSEDEQGRVLFLAHKHGILALAVWLLETHEVTDAALWPVVRQHSGAVWQSDASAAIVEEMTRRRPGAWARLEAKHAEAQRLAELAGQRYQSWVMSLISTDNPQDQYLLGRRRRAETTVHNTSMARLRAKLAELRGRRGA